MADYPTNPNPPPDPVIDYPFELLTVQDFANRYGVDASIVRSWIKKGVVKGELVGPRMMRVRRSDLLRTYTTPAAPVLAGVEAAAALIAARDGLDLSIARSVAEGMAPAEIVALLKEDITNGNR